MYRRPIATIAVAVGLTLIPAAPADGAPRPQTTAAYADGRLVTTWTGHVDPPRADLPCGTTVTFYWLTGPVPKRENPSLVRRANGDTWTGATAGCSR